MTKLLAIRMDTALAGHVVYALLRHLDWLRDGGQSEPEDLIDFLWFMREVANDAPKASHAVIVDQPRDTGHSVRREYLSRSDVKQITGRSLPTIDRWIKDGRLASVKRGRSRLIKRANLERFLDDAELCGEGREDNAADLG